MAKSVGESLQLHSKDTELLKGFDRIYIPQNDLESLAMYCPHRD